MQMTENQNLRQAEQALLKRYAELVNSGDAGNWYQEAELEVIAARQVLALPTAEPVGELPELPEPDSFLFQHDETGNTMFVDAQQVEWGFEKNNPRLHKIGGAFTEGQMRAYARAALSAGDAVDSQRLDFIEKSARCDPKMDGQHVWWPTSLNKALKGPTLRAAIDAAMRKDKP